MSFHDITVEDDISFHDITKKTLPRNYRTFRDDVSHFLVTLVSCIPGANWSYIYTLSVYEMDF